MISDALLHGESFDSPVQRFMNPTFRSCLVSDNYSFKKEMMIKDDIRHLPVLILTVLLRIFTSSGFAPTR